MRGSTTPLIPVLSLRSKSFGYYGQCHAQLSSSLAVVTAKYLVGRRTCDRMLCLFPAATPGMISKGYSHWNPTTRNLSTGDSAPSSSSSTASEQKKTSKSLTHSEKQDGAIVMSTGEKVKENVKTATYGGVILAGIGLAGALVYLVAQEMFSRDSPNSIYSHSFKLCTLSTEVQDALGQPIRCFGEETRRGWRRHVAHTLLRDKDDTVLRMRFYIEGAFNKATVHVQKRMLSEKGHFEYDYLIVDINYPPQRINVPF